MTDAEFECLLQMSKNFVKYKVDLRKAIEWMMVGMQIAVEDSEKPPA